MRWAGYVTCMKVMKMHCLSQKIRLKVGANHEVLITNRITISFSRNTLPHGISQTLIYFSLTSFSRKRGLSMHADIIIQCQFQQYGFLYNSVYFILLWPVLYSAQKIMVTSWLT
jgi:hypothetical protein